MPRRGRIGWVVAVVVDDKGESRMGSVRRDAMMDTIVGEWESAVVNRRRRQRPLRKGMPPSLKLSVPGRKRPLSSYMCHVSLAGAQASNQSV